VTAIIIFSDVADAPLLYTIHPTKAKHSLTDATVRSFSEKWEGIHCVCEAHNTPLHMLTIIHNKELILNNI